MGNNFLAQTHTVDMCIDFSRRDTLVSKHHLYNTQVGTALEQMSGKGVTECVRTHVLLYAHALHKFLDVMEHRYARKRLLKALADEDIILVTALYGYSVAVGEIGLEFGNGTRRNGDKALFVALARHAYELLLEIEIGHAQ